MAELGVKPSRERSLRLLFKELIMRNTTCPEMIDVSNSGRFDRFALHVHIKPGTVGNDPLGVYGAGRSLSRRRIVPKAQR